MPGYISEVKYEGGSDNFVEFAIPTGTDTSGYTFVVYNNDGTVISTHSLGSVVATISGKDVYVVDDLTGGLPDVRDNDAIALVDDTGTVLQFLGFKESFTAIEGPANGMTTQITGDISPKGGSVVTGDGGTSYSSAASPDPGAIPCFAPGTLIDTPQGPVCVENLVIGQSVLSASGAADPIVFIRKKTQDLRRVAQDGLPVRIARNALGAGCPDRDLVVSPQHRILVGGQRQLSGLYLQPRLVPAKALVGLPGISADRLADRITWTHFALPCHRVVTAQGCETESMLVGRMVLKGLTRMQRQGLLSKLDGCSDPGVIQTPALPCERVSHARRRIAAWLDRLQLDAAQEVFAKAA